MKRIDRSLHRAACLLLACLAAGTASAGTLTFDGLSHGSVVSTVGNVNGVTDSAFVLPSAIQSIQAINATPGTQLAVTYDSDLPFVGEDPDLQAPWTGGNLAAGGNRFDGVPLGFIAVLQENGTGCGDGICDLPDDEGARPAGQLILTFAQDIDSIGFDLVDVEGPDEFNNDAGYVATFYMNGAQQAQVGFGDFIDASSAFYQEGVAYGNNFANRIDAITAAELGMTAFDQVVFDFGGSMGIDNINWTDHTPPELASPGALLLLALGLLGMAPGILRRTR